MTETNVERAFFVAMLLAVSLAFFWLIRGFLQPIFWAVALGIVVYPLHARLQRRLHDRTALAAIISVVAVVIVVILPLVGLGAAVANEGTALYERLQSGGLGVEGIYAGIQRRVPQESPCTLDGQEVKQTPHRPGSRPRATASARRECLPRSPHPGPRACWRAASTPWPAASCPDAARSALPPFGCSRDPSSATGCR